MVEAGRALVIAINKWDTLDEDRHFQLEKEIERELARVKWATPGQHLGVDRPRRQQARRPPAGGARVVGDAGADGGAQHLRAGAGQETPPPARGGRAPKIKYVTQADVRPPRFVVFSTGFLEAGYRRFLERKLREQWGFEGTPIEVSVKVREGRGNDKPKG